MEALFGDGKPLFTCRSRTLTEGETARTIVTRMLLPWSVIYSETTGMVSADVNCSDMMDAKI
jgi:hypothetical protein